MIVAWVCYVYQDRYVTSTSSRRDSDDPRDYNSKVRLYDFNPLRVKREISRRSDLSSKGNHISRLSAPDVIQSQSSSTTYTSGRSRTGLRSESMSSSVGPSLVPPTPASLVKSPLDGEIDGLTLILSETVLREQLPLSAEIRTGREFPFMFVEKVCQAETFLLDDERLIAVYVSLELGV